MFGLLLVLVNHS